MSDKIDISPEAIEQLATWAEGDDIRDASECAAHLRALSVENVALKSERDAMMVEVEQLLDALVTIRDKRKQCNRAVDCQQVARDAIVAHEAAQK